MVLEMIKNKKMLLNNIRFVYCITVPYSVQLRLRAVRKSLGKQKFFKNSWKFAKSELSNEKSRNTVPSIN